MKLIVGLGNPGKEYENTRHNAGFIVLDELASKLNISFTSSKWKGLVAQTRIGKESVILLKPQTYMNLSGESVIQVMNFYNIDVEDILIIYDDKDIPIGKIKLKPQGSAGGHNGIKNIINHIHTEKFNRIRVGIGSNNKQIMSDFVLGKIDKSTREEFDIAVKNAVDASIMSIERSFSDTMNKYNQK